MKNVCRCIFQTIKKQRKDKTKTFPLFFEYIQRVVKISQRDFNLSMDTYLSRRKKPEVSKKKKPKKKKNDEKEFNDEEKEYFEERNFFQKVVNFVAGEPERKPKPIDEEAKLEKEETSEDSDEFDEFEKTAPKKGGFNMIKKIKSWFSSDDEEKYSEIEEEIESDEPAIPEDIKDVLKIQNRWLICTGTSESALMFSLRHLNTSPATSITTESFFAVSLTSKLPGGLRYLFRRCARTWDVCFTSSV